MTLQRTPAAPPASAPAVPPSAAPPRGEWFREAAVGLFLHYGPYALLERGEQVLFREHLPHAEYRALAERFNPRPDAADLWARTARAAGMRYAVLTTKHCDGFCLFDTATTSYSLAHHRGRDLVAEFVAAARRHDLRIGLYFSLIDWNVPAYFEGPERNPDGFRAFRDMTHAQLRELATNYGPIDEFWFDGDLHMWPQDSYPGDPRLWDCAGMLALLRQLQPRALVNERLGLPADIQVSEQHIGRHQERFLSETAMTSQARWWGYIANDPWRAPGEILRQLCTAAGNGSNYLLNVGPLADGALPQPFLERASALGDWLARNGEAIYGAEPNPGLETQTYGSVTCKGDRLFVHLFYGLPAALRIAGIVSPVRSARVLASGRPLRVEQRDAAVSVFNDGDAGPAGESIPVIELRLDGPPRLADWAPMQLWTCRDKSALADWARHS